MVSLKNKNKGFTIVELLIVIVVIGILATLVIVTFTGIQQKARNSQRQTDINAVDSHVEAYYASTGNYPTYAQLNTASWVSTNLKGLDPEALVDPKGGSIQNGAGNATHYGYSATESTNTNAPCANPSGDTAQDDTNCDTFTLTATLEGSGDTYTKKSN